MKQVSEEVLFAEDSTVVVGHGEIDLLKGKAEFTQRKRMRLCAHQDVEDKLHEMFIVHTSDTYVRPHKHLNKAESLHIIEGLVDLVLFDDEGNITGAVQLGDYSSGKRFYHRTSGPCYHTLLIKSDVVVFHEATTGPFLRADSVFAPWSPEESDSGAVEEFVRRLATEVDRFVNAPDEPTISINKVGLQDE